MSAHLHMHTHAHTDICVGKGVFFVRTHHFYIQPHMSGKVTPVFFNVGPNLKSTASKLFVIYDSKFQQSAARKGEEERKKEKHLYQECVLSLLCNRLSVSLDLCTSRGLRLG